MPSVVVPAHNEAAVIGRLLAALTVEGAAPADLELVVVSNGCTDDTAERARRFGGVQVVELAEGSKHLALLAGDAHVSTFPRLYIDADVEIDLTSVRALLAALDEPGVEAVAPRRELDLGGSGWAVRAYYRVWQQLPAVRAGLFGRGVMGVTRNGFDRIAGRPDVLGDDLYLSSRFTPDERRVVEAAVSIVHGPRSVADLLRRRARSAQGNTQLIVARGAQSSAQGSLRAVSALARSRPSTLPDVAVFVAITLIGRVRGRRRHRRGSTTWLRDESSRA